MLDKLKKFAQIEIIPKAPKGNCSNWILSFGLLCGFLLFNPLGWSWLHHDLDFPYMFEIIFCIEIAGIIGLLVYLKRKGEKYKSAYIVVLGFFYLLIVMTILFILFGLALRGKCGILCGNI